MSKKIDSVLFHEWFFDRLIWPVLSGKWTVKIRDFKHSKEKEERNILGLTAQNNDEEGGIIYLDIKHGTSKVLIHELGHVLLGEILDDEARDKNETTEKVDKWVESYILTFEKYFFSCLSSKQKRILKVFIDKAKVEYDNSSVS